MLVIQFNLETLYRFFSNDIIYAVFVAVSVSLAAVVIYANYFDIKHQNKADGVNATSIQSKKIDESIAQETNEVLRRTAITINEQMVNARAMKYKDTRPLYILKTEQCNDSAADVWWGNKKHLSLVASRDFQSAGSSYSDCALKGKKIKAIYLHQNVECESKSCDILKKSIAYHGEQCWPGEWKHMEG